MRENVRIIWQMGREHLIMKIATKNMWEISKMENMMAKVYYII